MSVNLSPIGNGFQFFDTNGKPLNAGLLNTYAAGISTPQPTFTTNVGNVQNSNPIVLGVDGRPPQEIWLTAGVAYKFVLTDSLSNIIGSYDNLVGINDINVSSTVNEWTTGAFPGLTYINATQFSITGDQTAILTLNRRVKTTNTGGTIYGYITASSFGTGVTTVTIITDAGSLDSGLSVVAYGINNPTNPSIPQSYARRDVANTFAADQTISSTDTGAGVGPINYLYRNSGSPAVSDFIGSVYFDGNNGSGTRKTYARVTPLLDNVTAGAEQGRLRFHILVAGSEVIVAELGKGIILGSPTGSFIAQDALNAAAGLYDNGTRVISLVPGGTGQTWYDKSGSRAINTTYTNSTGYPIQVCVSSSTPGSDQTVSFKVGASPAEDPPTITINSTGMGPSNPQARFSASAEIPNGGTYRLNNGGINTWAEFRHSA